MKNRITYGQSFLDADSGINYGDKKPWDPSIEEYARIIDKSGKTFYENESVLASIKRRADRETPDKDSYNARLYSYPTGQHVTIYDKTINKTEISENFRRTYQNEDRTEEEQEHCISVSMARTKSSIYNLARSYEWKWFITLTFDRNKTDASNYELVSKRLRKNLEHTKERKCPNLKYLIVPELHSDKTNYHFHGLLTDCDELEFVFSGHFDNNGRPVFNIPSWRWGFTTATLIGDTKRASGYICKYVTKDTERYLYGKRRYFSNAKKTEGEKFVVDKNEFLEMYADDISYMKDVYIDAAHQHVTYFEMPYSYNNKEQERIINLSPHSQVQLDACKITLKDILSAHPYEYRYVRIIGKE